MKALYIYLDQASNVSPLAFKKTSISYYGCENTTKMPIL